LIELITSYFPIALVISLFALLWIFLYCFRKYYRLKNLRLPFTQNLLRSPGQSLLNGIDDLNHEITIDLVHLLFAPIFIYAVYISDLYFAKRTPSLSALGLMGLFILALLAFYLYRLTRSLRRRRLLRLGYDGEVAVGQELNQLLRHGYQVYHDFPAGKFNIDHIAVGTKGVFAVETKARSKPNSRQRREDATVEYNGKVLFFPNWTDTKTIEQTELQAEWLSKWLGKAIGQPVAARGIVALPGWFVKRTSADGIPVVNPKQFPSLFEHIQPRALSEETIKRIVHQLEQKCRDVEPTSKITQPESSQI
jgi:hypothetical protein